MRLRFLTFLVAFSTVIFGFPAVFQEDSPSPGPSLQLHYRSLQPGEAVKVIMRADAGARSAQISFIEKKTLLVPGEKPGDFFGFVGIDLGLKPGTYPMRIACVYPDGTAKELLREIHIQQKIFPLSRLRVPQQYVTPPAEEIERIRLEAELVAEIYRMFTHEWMGEGSFILPSEGEVNPNFGERRIFNDLPRSPHSGVDIASPFGSPVKASNTGRVVLAHSLYFAGKSVIIDHGLGVFTFYCHLSQIKVHRGQLVQKGEIIGEVGATGRVTGPHLHWAVRIGGSRVDPFSMISLTSD
ncbi:MAG: M23 family metallopeptidase [Candidatus Aminicenantales bacterium]